MIRLEGVSKYYNTDNNVVLGLRRVNLEFKLGEFVAITGESGSGKSTLLNVISGLDKYDEGELYVNGEETSYYSVEEFEQYRKQYIGFVFQNYNIIDSYTVYQNVMAALMIQGYDKTKRKERALELIDRVGLSSHKNHRASKLSGGQKQRAVIARALAKDCPVIVADEPTGNLDSETGKKVLELLKEVSKDKLVLIVTHNYDQVEPYATRKIRMFDGEVVEDKTIKNVEIADVKPQLTSKNLNPMDVFKLALVSLFSIPKKSFLVFITLMFAFTAIDSIYSLNEWFKDSNFTDNSNPVFRNNFEGRVVVTKRDSSLFTQTELNDLLSKNRVQYLLHHDALLETEFQLLDNNNMSYSYGSLLPSFGQALNLDSGRLPENSTEIVVYPNYWGATYTIGDEITVKYIPARQNEFEVDLTGSFTLTIVGLLEEGYYDFIGVVHPSFFNQTTTNVVNTNNLMAAFSINRMSEVNLEDKNDSDNQFMFRKEIIYIDDSLPNNQALISSGYYDALITLYGSQANLQAAEFSLIKPAYKFSPSERVDMVIAGEVETDAWQEVVFMNSNTYADLFFEGPYQITLLVEDTFDAKQVIASLGDDYKAVHPFEYVGFVYDNGLGGLMGFIYFLVGTFIYIILNLVIKSIIQSRKKDFIIFRSIGASKSDLRKLLSIEQVLYSAFGFVLSFIPLIIMNIYIPSFKVMRYIGIPIYLIIFFIFLAVLLFINNKFANKIFGKSVITTLKSE